MGDFKYHEDKGEVILIAGGSGMAPMVPLLEEMANKDVKRRITYFFGVGNGKDLFYTDLIRSFEKRLHHFQYIPTLSRPEPDLQWKGETGLITAPLERHLKALDIEGAQAYLCGSPGMIKACTQLLNRYDIKNSNIFFDPFA
jgi:Na+-transporting NADH:ubiquinone oxidoreductase subunit F